MKPTYAQVTQVAAWRTPDGELFATAQEANIHAARLQFFHYYNHDNAIHGAETGDRVDERDMAQWLQENRTAVLEFLLLTAQQQKEASHAV